MFQVNPLLAENSHEKSSLIFSKDKSKNLKCRLLQFLFGAVGLGLVETPFMTMIIVVCLSEVIIFKITKYDA